MRRVSRCAGVNAFLPAVVYVLLAGGAAEAGWGGRETTKDGALHVMNPGAPIETPSAVAPRELWRAGGADDEDVLFGVLTSIAADADGNLYLLDQQLNEVVVFGRNGEHLRSIGREGEGPGEFRRPSGLFITPEGYVAVLQSMPGRIILLTREGEPVGNHPVPEAPDRGMMMFFQGDRAGDRIVLDTQSFARTETSMNVHRKLIAIDSKGDMKQTFLERKSERNFASMSFDEKEMRGIVWACGDDGRVYISDDFDSYRVQVWNAGGSLDRVIETEYTHRKRSQEEMERNRPRIMIRRGDRNEAPEAKASETDRDIVAMFPREAGSLWVLSSRGANDAPAGAIATFDVYDRDGKFARQVSVKGDGRFVDDGLHFVGDRLVVVKGLRSAQRSQMGGESEASAEDLDDAEPMSVVCYDLGPIVQGRK